MLDCANLIHPFQNDPGVSQRQRIMEDLLSGSAKIDGRSMADLLDYFVQLSRHVNYYDKDLNISDWQPFFQKSIPFSLAAIIKYDRVGVSQAIDAYSKLFDKRPSRTGVQLLLHHMFHRIINPLNKWHLQSKGSGLPVELILEKLIRDKLRVPLAKFLCYHNAAVRWYCVKPLEFLRLSENEAWNLDLNKDAGDCKPKGKTKRARLIALRDSIKDLVPTFLDVIRVISDVAAQSMEQSFFPLKEELKETHTPHLALLFAFLKLFQHLQTDLNKFTRKHLDFFYKRVLQIKSRGSIPDKVHLVFEIQKQLDKYLFEKGLLVKDGKDVNKAEILFATDDEIVVNKTQVAEKRTLFVNNQDLVTATYVEGVYIAPNADKADGLQQDFPDGTLNSFATLGAKYSKYKDPEKQTVNAYPNARIGFILASPVLLLNEGKRNITISLACKLDNSCVGGGYPNSFAPALLYPKVRKLAAKGFYYISQKLISEAEKSGISQPTLTKLWKFLFDKFHDGCCGRETVYSTDTVITARNWRLSLYNGLNESEKTVLSALFPQRRIFKIFFSGKEEWIEPSNIRRIRFSALNAATKEFTITIKTRLKPDKPAVTFYDKNKLKEDFNTTQPLVKVELDDGIKIFRGFDVPRTSCCLQIKPGNEKRYVSFYHFFRDVIIIDKTENKETRIDVRVCGLKKFVVQNDESLQDVNGPVYPFGTRPRINANFYIGSEEIFLKKWLDIFININWKDLPVYSTPLPDPLNGKPFQFYYNGYQDFLINSGVEINTVMDNKFRAQIAVLQDGIWNQWKHNENCSGTGDPKCQLFQKMPVAFSCQDDKFFTHQFQINRVADYAAPGLPLPSEELKYQGVDRFDVTTRQGFLRITLKCQDFQHDKYPFVLARQMTALGKLPQIVDGAVYYGVVLGGPIPQFVTIEMPVILQEIITHYNLSLNPNLLTNLDLLINEINNLANPPQNVTSAVWTKLFVTDDPSTIFPNDAPPFNSPQIPFLNPEEHSDYYVTLRTILDWLKGLKEKIQNFKDKGVVIPKEPWTPIIKEISLDYVATAPISDTKLIHLYPYQNTYKQEEIELKPTLVPAHCDEGTLFIGLKDLVPGSNVNMLFQLAEATADSESDYEKVAWHYLDNNQWKPLREGFEMLDDATDGLTTSGIIKFGLPANMTRDNTILPKGLHWIKASVPKNSRTVSETIAIYTQAIRATFTNDDVNDKLRLDQPLAAGSISRLNEADANLKKLIQPYDSFGGRVPEAEGHFYVRVSEMLRHKGRAIQKFDYERLVLELFPQVFKAKCINHSFALNGYKYKNDFPIAPGYVLLVVIPDLKQLKAAQSFEPRVPVSMLDDIEEQLKNLTSPFVRLRAMNPRYEKIHFCLTVKLVLGKDENYYKEKLKQDLREFLAPWSVGQFEKLTFGQCVSRSEVVRFLEARDYVDYIIELLMRHNEDNWPDKLNEKELVKPICPKTPRSILIAGDVDVCIRQDICEDWQAGTNCENKKIPISDYCLRSIPG
jgi:hypothetical protein